MTIHAEIILDIISQDSGETTMHIIERAGRSDVACLATLHRALKWLEEEKFINISVGGGDARKRTCSIAQRGTIYLKSLDF
jgi:Fe2+ or Zn2+ uptake regulation protein